MAGRRWGTQRQCHSPRRTRLATVASTPARLAIPRSGRRVRLLAHVSPRRRGPAPPPCIAASFRGPRRLPPPAAEDGPDRGGGGLAVANASANAPPITGQQEAECREGTSGGNSLSAGVFQTGQEPPGWPCMPFNPKVTGSIPVRPTSRPPGLPPAALPCSRPLTPTGRGTSGRTSGSGTRRRSRRPARATRGSCWAPCRWCLRCASGTASASRPRWDQRSMPPSRRA